MSKKRKILTIALCVLLVVATVLPMVASIFV